MCCTWEVVARAIDVNVLEQLTETVCRFDSFDDLPFQLIDMERLRFQLTIKLNKIREPFCEIIIASFHLFSEYLLMMTV